MKILFDHLCFNQKFGGVPKYFVELIKRIPKDDVILSVRFSNNEYLKELSIKNLYSFLSIVNFKGKARLEKFIGIILSISYLLKNNFNIYHQTHYDPYAFIFLRKKVKIVTTIHDMNYLTIPNYYKFSKKKIKNQLISMKKADHIITVSNNSKNDICKYLKIPEDKISVIYHGIDTSKYANISAHDSASPYILFVGARNAYKNFVGFVNSFAILKKKHFDLKLYCAGIYPSSSEKTFLKQAGVIDSVMFFQASDEQLISLYKGAKLFVFPSYYEGFGLPILEAMAANCPIALSNTSCFPEIAQEAGAYFNPYDINDMTSVIEKVLSDEDYCFDLKEKGEKLVKKFSWKKCAHQHMEVYQSLL